MLSVSFHLSQKLRFADAPKDIEYLELSAGEYTTTYLGARAIHKRRQGLFLEQQRIKMAEQYFFHGNIEYYSHKIIFLIVHICNTKQLI